MINHWWLPLYVSARGLSTSFMHTGGRGLAVEFDFDFVDFALACRNSSCRTGRVPLEPQSVAQFFAATIAALPDLEVAVSIVPGPSR